MSARARLQRFAWFFVLWFLIVGAGVVFVFAQYTREFFTLPFLPAQEKVVQPQLVLGVEPPRVSARSLWLYDRQSGSLLYEYNAQTATSVASLAKLMTAYASYESYSLADEVRVGSAAAVLGNRAKFLPRDVFTVADLLKAMLIFSANDAAQALAQAHPGGVEGFVWNMNERAKDLGLRSTHFDNSYGIDSPGQYSTAEDLGKLTLALLNVPFFEETVSLATAPVRELRTGRVDTVYTTNTLLYRSSAIKGVKTGTTELAGESLIIRGKFEPGSATSSAFFAQTASEAAQLTLQPPADFVLVILGSQDRYSDATKLLQWAAQNVTWKEDHIAR
jgi:D-alanyl-D-alanine carboxypeptidase